MKPNEGDIFVRENGKDTRNRERNRRDGFAVVSLSIAARLVAGIRRRL